MARAALPKSKLKIRRRRQKVRVLIVMFGIILLCIASLAALTYLPFWRITSVTVVGSESVPGRNIESVAKAEMRGAYFSLISKNNSFLYPKERIVSELRSRYPALSGVELRRQNLQTLVVEVSEYSAYALWCGESVASSSSCLLMDGAGSAYGSAVSFGGSSYVRYYGALSTTTLPRKYLPEEFRALRALQSELEKKVPGDTLSSVSVDSYKDVRAEWRSGFELLFSLTHEGAEILERFELALLAEPFVNNPLSSFEYLDLRFGDKLYYKLKSE